MSHPMSASNGMNVCPASIARSRQKTVERTPKNVKIKPPMSIQKKTLVYVQMGTKPSQSQSMGCGN